MRPFLIAAIALVLALAIGPAIAQECKAVDGYGRPLFGAARVSAMQKCCEEHAAIKDGKPVTGAEKESFVKKCMAGG